MATHPEITKRYPIEIELDESLGSPGHRFIVSGPVVSRSSGRCRLMSAADKDSVHLLARNLPKEDLLLRNDITDPATADDWIDSIEKGTT